MRARIGFRTGVPGGNGRRPEDLALDVRNHFVYWIYNATDECIYVGCTRHPEQRWRDHRRNNKLMGAEASYCRMAGPYNYATARRIERAEQFDLSPKYNGRRPITRHRDDAPWKKWAPVTYLEDARRA